MNRNAIRRAWVLLFAVMSVCARAAAETSQTIEVRLDADHWDRPVLRIGQNYTLKADDAVRDIAVIFGDAIIEGRVDDNVVVVFGKAQVASTAVIDGSLVVVGGNAFVAGGALVRSDVVIVGGELDSPAGFSPGGQYIVVGPAAVGGRLEAVVPWITRGLLWGRPIVPNLPWIWWIVAVFFLVYLALNLVFDPPVRASAATLAQKPLTAFVVGLLVLLLAGPVCMLLAVSVIGIAVIPFVICAIFIAALLGKIGVARWIGASVLRQSLEDTRLHAVVTFVIGFAVITVAYMVPVLGLAAWSMLGVFGLGAATLAFITAYRRENPPPPPRVSVGPPVVPSAPAAAPTPLVHGGTPPTSASIVEPAPSFESAPGARAEAAAASVAPVGAAGPLGSPPVAADLTAFPRAPFRDRLGAFALDVILVLVAKELLDLNRRDSEVFFFLLLAYHIGFWTWKATTIGGIICQLRVVRIDGAPLRFVDALVRGLSSIFSLVVLGIGCFWILRDPERQAWHDKIAGTYVVKVPRNWPL